MTRIILFITLLFFQFANAGNPRLTDHSLYRPGQPAPMEASMDGKRFNVRFVVWRNMVFSIWVWRNGAWERRHTRIYGEGPDGVDRYMIYSIDTTRTQWRGPVIVRIVVEDMIEFAPRG